MFLPSPPTSIRKPLPSTEQTRFTEASPVLQLRLLDRASAGHFLGMFVIHEDVQKAWSCSLFDSDQVPDALYRMLRDA